MVTSSKIKWQVKKKRSFKFARMGSGMFFLVLPKTLMKVPASFSEKKRVINVKQRYLKKCFYRINYGKSNGIVE